jgi:CHAT domain-containing protein
MQALAVLALAWALGMTAAADTPADDKALATELLAQTDTPARERWLEAHPAQITPALGRALAAEALALQQAGGYEPALRAFGLALRLGELTGDPDSRIRGLHGQGEVERIQGRLADALLLLQRAMVEAEAAADQPAVARISGSLGLVRLGLGEYGAALEIFERQAATFEALGDVRACGQAQSNIGIALGTIGRFEEARAAFERSRELMETAGNAPGIARAYNNLGVTQRNLGNYVAALEGLDHSLQLKEAAGDRPALPSTLKNIGDVYQLQGALPQALEYFRRSYALAAELGQKPAMVEALHDEGRTLLELDRPQEALALLERSLALAQETQNVEAITFVTMALAEAHYSLGDRARTLQLLTTTLEAAERTQQFPLLAHACWQIASLRLEEHNATQALALAERAAETGRRYTLREELWRALLVAGRAHAALGHPDLAEVALREAVDVIEDLRAHAAGPEADRAEFLTSRATPYQELVSLLADGGRSWDALAVAERSKGRVLLDVLAGRRLAIGAALSDAEKATEHRLEADVLTSNSELRALLQRAQPDALRQKGLESRRTAQRLALEDWRTRQYAAHPELRVLRGESRPLTREDAGRLLTDRRTVLLEYVLAGQQAYLFTLSAGASAEPLLSVRRLGMESGELARLSHDLRQRLAARDMEFAEPAARLYQALISPAREVLGAGRRVVLVPDGALWELPFQALRSPTGRFLVEEVAVSYAPSLSVLRDMHAHHRTHGRPERDLLALANPESDAGARRHSTAALMSSTLEPLPEAEAQVRAIARLYDSGAAAVRVGLGANESWLKSEAPRYRVLHLATHGVLDDASPLYSQLVLSAPAVGDHDDGLLEAREILELNLSADLAVLSACETGRGRAGAGEGLIGMSWAFFVAGCPTTVASLWKVESSSTSRLMLAFHRELRRGQAPADALRLAELAQLRRPDQRHPFYWAGFVAVGDAYSPLSDEPTHTHAAH